MAWRCLRSLKVGFLTLLWQIWHFRCGSREPLDAVMAIFGADAGIFSEGVVTWVNISPGLGWNPVVCCNCSGIQQWANSHHHSLVILSIWHPIRAKWSVLKSFAKPNVIRGLSWDYKMWFSGDIMRIVSRSNFRKRWVYCYNSLRSSVQSYSRTSSLPSADIWKVMVSQFPWLLNYWNSWTTLWVKFKCGVSQCYEG